MRQQIRFLNIRHSVTQPEAFVRHKNDLPLRTLLFVCFVDEEQTEVSTITNYNQIETNRTNLCALSSSSQRNKTFSAWSLHNCSLFSVSNLQCLSLHFRRHVVFICTHFSC